jgi:hypothetical protein
LAVGSFGIDVVAPQRDCAREGLRKLDLVVLAVTINVNDSPFTACGQDAVFALDRMPESHNAEFRDAAAFCEQLALPNTNKSLIFGRLKLLYAVCNTFK